MNVDGASLTAAASSSTNPWQLALGSTGSDGTSITAQDLAVFSTLLSGAQVATLYGVYHLLQDVEYTGQRIAKALLIAGFANYPQSIATGIQLCAGETTSQTSVALLDYIDTINVVELGYYYQRPDGVFIFNDANWIVSNPTSNTPQTVLGDNLTADSHYFPNVKIPLDNQLLYTDIQIQPEASTLAGATSEVLSPTAMAPGGPGKRILQRTGAPFYTDAQALAQANLLLGRYSVPRKRLDNATPPGRGDEADSVLRCRMLARQLGSACTVQRQGSRETQFSRDMVIERRHHKWVAKDGDYGVDWIASPYEITTPGTQTITATGTWVAPAGVTQVDVQCWGQGGTGAVRGGGGGGAYAETKTIAVTAGTTYNITINATHTQFVGDTASVIAAAGSNASANTGGAGGTTGSSTGAITFAGGSGGSYTSGVGSGGGGSGGSTGAGGNAPGGSSNAGGIAGTGTPPGAAGGAGSGPGNAPGGGGGGGSTGQAGGAGQVAAG